MQPTRSLRTSLIALRLMRAGTLLLMLAVLGGIAINMWSDLDPAAMIDAYLLGTFERHPVLPITLLLVVLSPVWLGSVLVHGLPRDEHLVLPVGCGATNNSAGLMTLALGLGSGAWWLFPLTGISLLIGGVRYLAWLAELANRYEDSPMARAVWQTRAIAIVSLPVLGLTMAAWPAAAMWVWRYAVPGVFLVGTWRTFVACGRAAPHLRAALSPLARAVTMASMPDASELPGEVDSADELPEPDDEPPAPPSSSADQQEP
ncbi:MAG: hypothetical protein AB7K09_00705 [Planctomycetota bacterium]